MTENGSTGALKRKDRAHLLRQKTSTDGTDLKWVRLSIAGRVPDEPDESTYNCCSRGQPIAYPASWEQKPDDDSGSYGGLLYPKIRS